MHRSFRLVVAAAVIGAGGGALVPASASTQATKPPIKTTVTAGSFTGENKPISRMVAGTPFTVRGQIVKKGTHTGINEMSVTLYRRATPSASWSKLSSVSTLRRSGKNGTFIFEGGDLKGLSHSEYYEVRHHTQKLNGKTYAADTSNVFKITAVKPVIGTITARPNYAGGGVSDPTISGKGFTPNMDVWVLTCSTTATSYQGCYVGGPEKEGISGLTTDADGKFSFPYTPQQRKMSDGSSCQEGGDCDVRVVQAHASTLDGAAVAPIHFASLVDSTTGQKSASVPFSVSGSDLTLKGANYPASRSLDLVQCDLGQAQTDAHPIDACDTAGEVQVTTDADGNLPATTIKVHTGTVGDGSCYDHCFVEAVDDAFPSFWYGYATVTFTSPMSPGMAP